MSSSSTPVDRSSAPTRIRAAELTDLDALLAIENRCFDTDRLSRRSFRHLLTRGRAATLVAEHGGTVVGYVLVLFSHGTLHARTYSLAVDPAARGPRARSRPRPRLGGRGQGSGLQRDPARGPQGRTRRRSASTSRWATAASASSRTTTRTTRTRCATASRSEFIAADLSALVTKLRAARPDVLFHTGYNPDINLFLPQAKEQGLRVRVYVGHGAGHSQLDKLKEAFGKDVEAFHTVDPPASQLVDAKKLKPGLGDLTQEMVKRYKAYEANIPAQSIAPHVSMGFNNMWILLNDVLPRAIQKAGGWTPDALARAAVVTDILEGGTMQGYGVKFYGEGHPMSGQNERAIAAVFQVIEGQFKHVYPLVIATGSPIIPLPPSSPWAAR